jgi:uncharacterized protein (TIGR02001 family)
MARIAGWLISLVLLGAAAEVRAQDAWKGPFGGTWSTTFAFASEYSYRGVSQTDRKPAVQFTLGYEIPIVGKDVLLYLETFGTNVSLPSAATEVDVSATLKFFVLERKLSLDLVYARFNYLEAAAGLHYDYDEFSVVLGYDFTGFQLYGAIRYNPNYFQDSGSAWYKWIQATVPLFKIKDKISVKAFGSVGNQYIERFANTALPSDNYWDWEIGLKGRVYGVNLSLSYVDTSLDVAGCGGTLNCQGRALFKLSKAF